ncbi:sulfite exporter TauE/SafE family protein [Variovorax defluvii]
MQTALAGTALLMGLLGGPHCVAMCAAACSGVIRIVRPVGGGAAAASLPALSGEGRAAWIFHAGRIAGYAGAGAIAASAVQGLAAASSHAIALRPLWVVLHVFILAWGSALVVTGRQPLWAHRLGRGMSARLRPAVGTAPGLFATGALWVCMPCGLLYSALMLAGLANSPVGGAAAMALFAAGSGLSLVLAPWLWTRLAAGAGVVRKEWGCRLAGVMLAAMAVQAIWTDLSHQIELWCR